MMRTLVTASAVLLAGLLLGAAPASAGNLEVTVMDGWTSVEGATVTVKDSKGKKVDSGTTARDGQKSPKWESKNLPAGNYTVEAEYTDDQGKKKTGKQKMTVTATGTTKGSVIVDEKKDKSAAAIFISGHPLLAVGAGGILITPQDQVALGGSQVATDNPKHCKHQDGNGTPIGSTPGPVDDGDDDGDDPRDVVPDDEGGGLIVPGTKDDDDGDDPRDVGKPEKPKKEKHTGTVYCKTASAADGKGRANRSVKLIDSSVANPALAYNDANKQDDAGSGEDPKQCVTDSKGECSIAGVPLVANGGAPPKDAKLEVHVPDGSSWNAYASGAAVSALFSRFGASAASRITMFGRTFFTLSSPDDGAAIQAGAGDGVQVEPNKCSKEAPGPWIDHLDEFPDKPSRAFPGASIRIHTDHAMGESR